MIFFFYFFNKQKVLSGIYAFLEPDQIGFHLSCYEQNKVR